MTRPGRAFLAGWGGTSVVTVAFVAVDLIHQSSADTEGGLTGIAAVARFLFATAGLLVIGPLVGLICALIAWLMRRSGEQIDS